MQRIAPKNLLRKYHLQPNKVMGQNFLICPKVLKKIIKTADLKSDDAVLEIGPGLGTLTKELAKHSRKVITIEKDKNLIPILKQEMKGYKNVQIIRGDILKISRYPAQYKLVANIPYYLTSPLVRKFLTIKNPPQEMILMLQKEVAQRITAQPPKMTYLSVFVQFYSKPKIISYIPKSCFFPQPKVDSAIIKITDIKKPLHINQEEFFNLVKAGFSSPRKQLVNNLFQKLKIDKGEIRAMLKKCNIKEQARPGNLSVEDWKELTILIDDLGGR